MFISTAYAQTPAGGPFGGGGIEQFGVLILMLVVFWFILIRPQMKRAKEHKALLSMLEKGNEVVTAGGVVGKITKIAEGYITLEVAPGVEMTFQKQAVQTLLPKGSIKTL